MRTAGALADRSPINVKKHLVFSAVEGQVIHRGKPVAGLEVVQRWSWMMVDDGMATAKTDAKGRFRFPAVTVERDWVEEDASLDQDLGVVHKGKTITLWSLTRQDVGPKGELGGAPLVLTAELSAAPREQAVVVAKDQFVTVSGVSTFEHPYLERWEAVRAKVTPKGVAQALSAFLSSAAGLKALDAMVPQLGKQRARVVGVVSVKDVDLKDGFLHTAPKSGAFAVEGKGARYVGFCTRARVCLELDSGEQVEGGFFAWRMFLPLDAAGRPRWEAQFEDRWELDLRPWVARQLEAVLDRAKLTKLVRDALDAAPGFQPLEVLGSTPRKGKKASLGVESVELTDLKPNGSKDDWASIGVEGTFTLVGRNIRPRFSGSVSLKLASLDAAAYALAGDPHFSVIPFKVVLRTDKKTYAHKEPIVLRFEVENVLDTPQRFLKWHTPFEGFMNDFLELKPAGGEAVGYTGPLVSRAPPLDDDYISLAPGEKASSELEITQCYPVTKSGKYVLRYKPYGEVWADEARFSVK